MECDPQMAVRDAIIAIIRYHEENRADNGSVCMMGRFHNILYVAVKLCHDWQLKDTGTVVALLENIYACESTFERIFIGAIFGNRAPYYIAGWKSDFDSQEENVRAVVYFIDHATTGGLEFACGRNKELTRFVDVPMDSCGGDSPTPAKIALQLGLPDKLHILLRYGACLDENVVEYLLKRLMEFCHVYPYNIVACLQLVLRVIPRIEGEKSVIFDNYPDLVEDALIPPTRCGVQVPELKHLSRCCIRKRLWENYQLPNGIGTLTLPDSLRRYLDIMCD
jgi:ankyrin repeat/SOCS box protein 17